MQDDMKCLVFAALIVICQCLCLLKVEAQEDISNLTDPMQVLEAPDANALTETSQNNFSGYLRKAYTLYKLGNYAGALEPAECAVALEKDNATARKLLGDVLMRLRRYSEAEAEYQTVLLQKPNDVQITLSMADLYFEQGRYMNAQGLYQKALSQKANNAEAMIGLARSFEGSNDLASAADYYQQIIEQFPDTEYAKTAESRLSQLKNAQSEIKSDRYFPIDKDLGPQGLGWWDLNKMPLHVYIDDGAGVPGWRPELRNSVLKALQAWSACSRGTITFVVDPSDTQKESIWKRSEAQADVIQHIVSASTWREMMCVPADAIDSSIHVHWTDNLPSAVGLTWTSRFANGQALLSKAHIWLATNKLDDGTRIPQTQTPILASLLEAQSRMLDEVATHEMGHVLGLPHLSNPNDVMSGGRAGLHNSDQAMTRELSQRDIKALLEHYANCPNGASLAGGVPEEKPAREGESAESAADEDELPAQGSMKRIFSSFGYDPLREATFLIDAGHYDQSLQSIDKSLALDAKNAKAHYLRAVVFVHLRNYLGAEKEYKQVLKLVPGTDLAAKARTGLDRIKRAS